MPPIQAVFQPMMNVDRIEADDARRFRLRATGGGFFAKLLGMGSRASITADAAGFRLQKTTFGSDENTFIPRSKIASTVCVVMKPLEFLLAGLFTLPFFGLGLIFIIAYFLVKKRVIIGVVSAGGTVESVKLKASEDHLADIKAGMKTLEDLLREEAGTGSPAPPSASDRDSEEPPPRRSAAVAAPPPRRSFSPPPPPPPPPVAAASDETSIITCPSCGTRMSIPSSAAGRKVRCTSCREVFPARITE